MNGMVFVSCVVLVAVLMAASGALGYLIGWDCGASSTNAGWLRTLSRPMDVLRKATAP